MIKEREVNFGELGLITCARTYSRDKGNGEKESFSDIVNRELYGIKNQLNLNLNDDDVEFYKDMRHNMWGSVAGRFMWQLGTDTVDRLGLSSLQNCAFVTINEPVKPFTWAMDMLMLGSGVGYSVKREHVYKLPKISSNKFEIINENNASVNFIVPDTREGWVLLLEKVLKSYFYTGRGFTYSTQLVRESGSAIKGFGGVASGAGILIEGVSNICKVLDNRRGRQIKPIDALDIMNIIGSIVVAGNVRRSAQIAIGDYDDIEFLQAKSWNLGSIPNWRAMSNNSVDVSDTKLLPKEFWNTYEEGEPYGLINLELSRAIGRLGDTNYPDPSIEGFNPCAEQPLAPYETCCLAEIYLPNIDSYETLLRTATILYKVNKHSLSLKSHQKETEAIVNKNMRMGIGITGIMMCSEEQLGWLDSLYLDLRDFDKSYSHAMGWNESVKLTTVKPSGTLSLLAGVTPGVHPSTAGKYYIRRIQMSSNSELVEVIRSHGYHTEFRKNLDGTNDVTTIVAEFPCMYNGDVMSAKDISVFDQLETVKFMQKNWSDNSVSVTAYYNKEDLPNLKEYLNENFKDNFKSLSFLLNHGHGFIQAPYEAISKEKYEYIKSLVIPITNVNILEGDVKELESCSSGSCPVK